MVSERSRFAGYREWRLPLNSDSGFHTEILQLHNAHNPRSVRDYETYIARLNDVPRYFRENIANMRVGMRDGFTLPAEIIGGVGQVVAGLRFARPEDTPLWAPFADFPASVPEAERARLAAAGRAAIAEALIPAFDEFRVFFEADYAPRARRSIAASALPNGRAYYADLVRYYTTLPGATPQQVHRTGLAEVARIRGEMEAIVREVGFQGSFAEFLTFLRTDPQFYATTPEQLLREAAWITREIDAQMPRFFRPHSARAVHSRAGARGASAELHNRALQSRARSAPRANIGSTPMRCNVRPLYVLPSLTLHEAAPGHHTQGSLARELDRLAALPAKLLSARLRRRLGALFREARRGDGRLSHALSALRAAHLRDVARVPAGGGYRHACDGLVASARARLHDREHRALRPTKSAPRSTATSPGPARRSRTRPAKCASLALRARAEAALGERFDIRSFHDAVLGSGGVTLPVLEAADRCLHRRRALGAVELMMAPRHRIFRLGGWVSPTPRTAGFQPATCAKSAGL